MARDPDDEALSWGDENDPTYAAEPVRVEPAAPVLRKNAAPGVSDVQATGGTAPGSPAAPAPAASATSASATEAPATAPSATAAPASAPAPAPAATTSRGAAVPTVEEQAELADDAAAEQELATAEKETASLSSAALITFGIFGGVFLLYTVGWLVTFIRNPVDFSGLAGIVQGAQSILAIAAPALWFIVTLLLGARRRVPVRVIWLVIGVVVLLPWPFLTGN